MSIGKASTVVTKAKRPKATDFLSLLEDDIKHLAEIDAASTGTVKDTNHQGTRNGNGNKRVSFNSKIHQRRFDKNTAVVEYREDTEVSAEENESNSSQERISPGEHFDSEEEGDGQDGVEDAGFDSLSPAEQLKMLMEHVDDEDEGGYHDEDDDFGQDDEEDEETEGTAPEDDSDDDETGRAYQTVKAGRAEEKFLLPLDRDEDDEEGDQRPKSNFQRQQEKLKKRIAELEEESLAERPWMLRGEVTARSRPANSLLEQDLDFEHAMRPAPAITEEVTESIEALIRQRIKDQAWDDVERRVAPQAANAIITKKKLPELDGEPSKKSLSEVYEEEHQTSRQSTGPARTAMPIDEATQRAHDEISVLFKKLCHKIDALSSFKFAPRTYAMDEVTLKPLQTTKSQPSK